MEYREIRNIGVEHIHPHPDNPRKDLGELSELAESIKKNGVMQNLTVIPIEGKAGEYLAVIGHRRHAAAKLAGIAEVPCMVIEGFSKKE
ncbi:MAG: ParB N-terminal domain-containing protein, partial [Hungatella sp.]